MHVMRFTSNQDGFINFGWRGWEGELPTSFIRHCADHPTLDERTMVYYDETIELSAKRMQPLISYFHKDPRPDKFGGTSLTGVQPYMELQSQIYMVALYLLILLRKKNLGRQLKVF